MQDIIQLDSTLSDVTFHEEYTSTSKFLSLVLRHKPEVINLTIDEHGWADVNELLTKMSVKFPTTLEQLQYIVDTDAKQRYSFNHDKTKIRANQGHSFPVDLELVAHEPPKYLFHGTTSKYFDLIRSSGNISKMSRNYVHLTDDVNVAYDVAIRRKHADPIICIIDALAMYNEGFTFYLSANKVWLTDTVPLDYVVAFGVESLDDVEVIHDLYS